MSRFFYVEVIWGDDLRAKAIDQWTREIPVKALRGDILDRYGNVLASTKQTYAVFVRPRSVKNVEYTADRLSEILDLDKAWCLDKIKNAKSSEITLLRQVEKSKINELEKHDFDGVYYALDNSRVYPNNNLLCQTLGIISNDGNGIYGLESYYNEYLKGVDGEILYEADLVGKDISKNPSYKPAVNGLDLTLTIDLDVQKIVEAVVQSAYENYTPKNVSAIVMDPNNGDILAIASSPSFDLNQPPTDDLAALNKLSRNTLVVDSYEPGSTFKIFTAAADIEEYSLNNPDALSLDYVFNSSNVRVVDGRKIKCWTTHKNGRHQNERLQEALNNSCNPCFVDIALSLGKDVFYKYVNAANFGKATGVDFPGEAIGMLLPVSSVTQGDLARMSFGQTVAVTPLQLISGASALVNGGIYYEPHFMLDMSDKKSGVSVKYQQKSIRRVVSENTSKILAGYLENVVACGSGKNAFIEGYRVGGKTGTAQKFEDGKIAQGKYVMSFLGFFPANQPKYIALLTVDEPVGGSYGSTVSAPLVKEIFQGIIQAKNIQEIK
ncbi:MAG: peptidoglycan D,D-transpeptidase FtsI family protein [Christensenellaceae bacterium]